MIRILGASLAFFQLLKHSAIAIVGVTVVEVGLVCVEHEGELGVVDKVTVDVKVEELEDDDVVEDELDTGSPSSSRSCNVSSACGASLVATTCGASLVATT